MELNHELFTKSLPVRLLTPSIIVIMEFFSFGAEGVFSYIIPGSLKNGCCSVLTILAFGIIFEFVKNLVCNLFFVATGGIEPRTFHKVPTCAVAHILIKCYYGFDVF